MKIAAWSDGHGVLPKIKEYADVLIIAGDFTPLDIQRQTNECLKWFTNEFFNYVRKVNCKKVLLVPGNHDFLCERVSPKIIKEMIENNADIKDKLVYLIDEEYQYKGLKFYGTPWCINLHNWAFYTEDPKMSFSHIPQDCDVLITHQPPKIDRVGCSNPYTAWEYRFSYGFPCLPIKLSLRIFPFRHSYIYIIILIYKVNIIINRIRVKTVWIYYGKKGGK